MSHSQFDTDALFEVLASERRRRLLIDLLERTPGEAVETPPGRSAGDGEPERVQLELYHVHLPKMEDAGLVCWDRDTHDVTEGPQFERTRPALELLKDHSEKLPDGWF